MLAHLALVALQAGYLTGDPLGQRGCFKLDHNSTRTLSMIRDGKASQAVVRTAQDAQSGAEVYEVEVRYWLNVQLMGEKTGMLTIQVPKDYFTPEYMPALKQSGSVTTSGYKMDYLDTRDVTTLDGVAYPGCDYVHVKNISSVTPMPPVENLEMKVCVATGAPALGAVVLDITGRASGIRFKAGMDVTTDPAACPLGI